MTGHPCVPRGRPAGRMLALSLAGWAMAVVAVRAESATPWDVARTVRPNLPASPEPDGTVAPPRMSGQGFGAVMGPGARPRAQSDDASPVLPPSRLPPLDQSLAALNPLAASLGSLKAVRERPLFSPTRRPPPGAPPPPAAIEEMPAPPPAAPSLRLVGIVQDAERASGLVSRGTGPTFVVRAGDPVDGWEVGEIGPEHLTLRLGDQSETYRIFAAGPAAMMRPRPAARQGAR